LISLANLNMTVDSGNPSFLPPLLMIAKAQAILDYDNNYSIAQFSHA